MAQAPHTQPATGSREDRREAREEKRKTIPTLAGDSPTGSYLPGEKMPFKVGETLAPREPKTMEEVTAAGVREPGDADFPRPGQKGYPAKSKGPALDPAKVYAEYGHRASPYGIGSTNAG